MASLLLLSASPEADHQAEDIRKIGALRSFYETYLKSSSQILLQIHTILCTGEVSRTEMISIALILLTLTKGSLSKEMLTMQTLNQAS